MALHVSGEHTNLCSTTIRYACPYMDLESIEKGFTVWLSNCYIILSVQMLVYSTYVELTSRYTYFNWMF